MTETQKLINDFITDMEETIAENGNDFCIIVTAGNRYSSKPRFVYKSIEDFKEKGQKNIDSIDTMFSVDVLLWYFD